MTSAGAETAARILTESARLFATRGFAATSTRDIAAAVRIRQPGLYKHFGSKDAILLALFEEVFEYPTAVAAALTNVDAPACVKLYRFLDETAHHVLKSPLAVASLLRTPELRLRQFAPIRRLSRESDAFVAELVETAASEGDLRDLRSQSAPRLLFGLIDALASAAQPAPTKADVYDLLEFALYGLVRDRRRVEPIRRQAAALELYGLAN